MDTAQLQPLCHKHESEQKPGLEERQSTREQIAKAGKGCSPPGAAAGINIPGLSPSQSPSHPSPGGHCTYRSSRHPEPAGQMSSPPRRRRRRRRGTCPCGSAPAGPLLLLPRQQHQGWGLCATSSAPLCPPLWHRRSHPLKSSLKGFFAVG